MSTIVVMPLSDEYFEIGDEIYDTLQDPSTPPQTEKVSRCAELLVGSMLQVLIVDMINNVQMKPFAKKIVLQLESVIQKTANALVHKVILKLNNQELWPLVEYLRELEVELEGKRYLSFPLETFAEKAINKAYTEIDNKDLKQAKEHFDLGLQNILDQGLLIFYKKPMSMLKLGFVMRKIVDVGYAAIHAAVKPAIHKIVHDMDLHELESLKHYIETLTVEIE